MNTLQKALQEYLGGRKMCLTNPFIDQAIALKTSQRDWAISTMP
jgi:hypothetical protein